MATLVHMTEPVDHSTWEIEKDAFAPPPTRRLIRGWDRAPVSARAPRLHGQTVWKKVGSKVVSIENPQDDAEGELQREGAGARKKSRLLTARENINNATWVETTPDMCVKDIGSTHDSNEERSENDIRAELAIGRSNTDAKIPPSHKDDLSNAAEQDSTMHISQLIPRKRTNTDHVITPKKLLRQTTLDHKEQAPSTLEHPEGIVARTTRPRKSMRKSIIVTMSDNASNPRTCKAEARLSLSAEHLTGTEGAASSCNEPEASIKESTSKQRVLRRSTTATKRSIAHTEQPSDVNQIGPQRIELSQQDAKTSTASLSAELLPCGEPVTSIGPDEHSDTGNTNLCDIIGPDLTLPLETAKKCERSPGNSACVLTSITDSQALDPVDVKSPDISANCGDDNEQFEGAHAEEIISSSMETAHGQNVEISESQKRSLELQDRATSSTAEEQPMVHQATSNVDGVAAMADRGSLTGDFTVISPTHTKSPSSLEPRGIPQGLTDDPSKAPAESDIHQELQNVEISQVPDPSNLTATYDHDDTDMLRNFLTRVKANKAAKNPPKRKRSLPHSPLRIPLGDLDTNASPSPLQKVNELDMVEPSPSKRKKKNSHLAQCENEPEPRRSGRTRPPVKEPPGAPSFIPVRRLGQDIDTTITLKRNEEKELAALTRVNTRKNKGNSLTALEVLAKKSEEKEDPVMRQRLLREVFDEKMEKGKQDKEKGQEKKSVTWAEELAEFQTLTKGEPGQNNDDGEKEKSVVVQGGDDKKQGAVRVGVRSKAALGMVLNGTPAPKRKMRGRV